ncbi:MAG TPA: DUF4342 domain-containing protein [Ktedonobacteraceae bacterium]|nr:DUF4342 domain-containing protein [Ktedonobacteraceae bacterium]
MTQTYSNEPFSGQRQGQEYHEELHVMGDQLVTTVEHLLHEGNVRRIIIKQDEHTILELPLTVGVIGALVAPMLAAVGAIGAVLANCTIEVIRTEPEAFAERSAPGERASTPLLSDIGGQAYSIAHSGMQLFEQGRINTLMSSTVIDLVSAPIEPGEYRLNISVTMGGVEIFLPRSAQFTLEGSALAGGRKVHDGYYEGPHIWETVRQKLRYVVNLPEQPPDFAIAPANPERLVRIHFVTHITMGGVDIYRL